MDRNKKAQAGRNDGLIVQVLVARMAARGPGILAQLQEAVGADLRSGHVVDGLMTAASRFESACMRGDKSGAAEAAIAVLFLARDLAVREGKIKPAEVPQA